MIDICRSPEAVNALMNNPLVRPDIGPGTDDLDFSDAVARPENWFLLGEYGGFALIWSAPDVHEVHTVILPEGRGRWAKMAASEAIDFAWGQGDRMLWTKIPADRANVAIFAQSMGMHPTGQTVATFGKPFDVYMMEAQ